MMDKRALIAIALTFLVILFWGTIQSKFFPQPPADQPQKEVKKEEVAPAEKKEVKPLKEERSVSKPRVVIKKETSVETKNYLAVFTNEDARLKHFKLKQYEDRVEETSLTIKLIRFFQNLFGGKIEEPKKPKPLDLVNTKEDEGLPLGLIFQPSPDSGGWEVDKEKLQVLKAGEKGEIVFSKSLDNGLKLLKKYRFTSENNVIDIEVEVQNTTSNEITVQMGLEWTGRIELEKFADDTNKDFGLKYAFMKDQKVERKDLGGVSSSGCIPSCGSPKKKVEPFESSDQGAIGWYAFEGEYFTALLVPPSSEKNIFLSVKGNDKNILKAQLATSPVSVPPRGAIRTTYRIYLGPKVIDSLKELGVGAEGLIDFGFFTIVAKPLLWFLKLTNNVTKNFGIDIIILSI